MILSGHLCLTRNRRGQNMTPGYWNHAAIVADGPAGLCVVEIQRDFAQVTAFRVEPFLRRYPEWMVLAPKTGRDAADIAVQRAGRPNLWTFLPIRRRDVISAEWGRDNGVSFLRRCFWAATGHDYGWITPDDIASEGFCPVDRFSDPNWSPPTDKWDGRLT